MAPAPTRGLRMDIVAAPGRRPRSDAPQPQDASGLTWARKEEPCGGVVARTVGAGAAQRRSLDDVQDGLFLDAGNLAALEISTRHLPGAAASARLWAPPTARSSTSFLPRRSSSR